MPAEIFRKVSLDRLSSPEQIDQLLHVTTARSWVALLALCGTLAAGLVWSVTSFIKTSVNAQGVISRIEGINNVVALGTGTVLDIKVKIGDEIRAGQIIAQVAQPSLEQRLEQARAELGEAQQTKTLLLRARAEGDSARLAAMKRQIANHEQDIRDTIEQIQYAKEQIPVDDQLVEKGLITKQAALQDKQKVASLESRVEQLRVQIAQVTAQQVTMEHDTFQQSLERQSRVSDLGRNLQIAKHTFENASEVVSPGSGRVVEIISYRGAVVNSGQPILSYEPTHGRLETIAYAPADKAKEIRPGMEAHISPSGVQREEYGYLLGKVRAVGDFPATADAIAHTFENEALARAMMSAGPVMEVHIDLLTSSPNRSDYLWSSSKGPPGSITSGSVSSVEIVTRAQHPIELVIPYLKRKSGLR